MAEKPSVTVAFRSKHGNHHIKSGGLNIQFVAFTYRTDIPGEIALLRKRAAVPNSPIIEIKPGERVKVTIEKEPLPHSAANPEDLDVPEVTKGKK